MATVTASASSSPTAFNPTALGFSWNPVDLVGDALDNLMGRVTSSMDSVIQTAESSIVDAELEAGRQVGLAIQNAKIAYEAMLQDTIGKVQQAVLDDLNRLDGMVQEFQSKNADLLQGLTKKVQQFINTLPWSNLQPQLTSSGPKYIVIENDAMATLTFDGNFPNSTQPTKDFTLSFNNQPLELANSSTQSFTFKGQVSAIFPQTGGSIHTYSYSVGALKVLWDNTANLPFYKRWLGYTDVRNYEYKVLEEALPLSPGKITAIYTSTQEGQPIRKRFTMPFRFESGDDHPKRNCKDWTIIPRVVQPDTGFSMIHGTSTLKINAPRGNNHHSWSEGSNEVDVVIKLDNCSGRHMGSLYWSAEFDEIQPTTNEVIKQLPIDLKWGGSKDLQIQDPTYGRLVHLIYKAFDGSDEEFGTATDLSNRYLKVHNQGSSVKIQATPPSEIHNYLKSQHKA